MAAIIVLAREENEGDIDQEGSDETSSVGEYPNIEIAGETVQFH